MKFSSILTSFFCLLIAGHAFANTPNCDSLDKPHKADAQTLMQTIPSYGCCKGSVSECLNKTDATCKTPEFVADEICRLVAQNKQTKEIQKLIQNRANAMDTSKPASTIPLEPENVWGNPQSKTVLSVYLCGRCPYCSRHIPKLIHSLENTQLKDKFALNFRYFPIKSHPYSAQAAFGIAAAAKLGNAWPYILKSYDNFDAFSLGKIIDWGKELGMDPEEMNRFMKSPEVRKLVADSKKEGLVNGVTTTPTFFINGRKIDGGFDDVALISMIEEALAQNTKEEK